MRTWRSFESSCTPLAVQSSKPWLISFQHQGKLSLFLLLGPWILLCCSLPLKSCPLWCRSVPLLASGGWDDVWFITANSCKVKGGGERRKAADERDSNEWRLKEAGLRFVHISPLQHSIFSSQLHLEKAAAEFVPRLTASYNPVYILAADHHGWVYWQRGKLFFVQIRLFAAVYCDQALQQDWDLSFSLPMCVCVFKYSIQITSLPRPRQRSDPLSISTAKPGVTFPVLLPWTLSS